MKGLSSYNLIFIILIFLAIYFILSIFNTKEPFIPAINSMYRPFVRNTRISINNTFNKLNRHIDNYLRRSGIK